MKRVIIPAQVTTIEDKITGNLSIDQVLIIIDTLTYFLLPPVMLFSSYKLIAVIFITVFFLVIATRVLGRTIFSWAVLILKYSFRPKRFVFNKNTALWRD